MEGLRNSFVEAYDNVISGISAGITGTVQALSTFGRPDTRRFGNDVEDHEP